MGIAIDWFPLLSLASPLSLYKLASLSPFFASGPQGRLPANYMTLEDGPRPRNHRQVTTNESQDYEASIIRRGAREIASELHDY
jgi:hypothetical protein